MQPVRADHLVGAGRQHHAFIRTSADRPLSDRIIVMYGGRINAELDPNEATPELLGTYMTGGRPEAA